MVNTSEENIFTIDQEEEVSVIEVMSNAFHCNP